MRTRTSAATTRFGRPRTPATDSTRSLSSRALAGIAALLMTLGVLPATLMATTANAAVGQGFNLNASDLRFILAQIKISEAHAASATPADPCGTLLGEGVNQIPNQNGQGVLLPWGVRTVDGTCNNLTPGGVRVGAADNTFPRRTDPNFRTAESRPALFGPPPPGAVNPTTYAQKTGSVFDSVPRTASNLIVDQTVNNPSAVAAAGDGATPDESGTLFIPNTAPDVGLSAPFNSLFTLFGQFFDHGLDLTNKSGGTVFIPLAADDPLIVGGDGEAGTADDPANPPPPNQRFMVLTRSTNQPGPDGILGNADDVQNATNQTSSFVDQSQTYTSHPSHQVFLRQYELNTAGAPVSTGRMLTGPGDGLATWESTKTQARTLLGIELRDADVLNIPLLATDQYGKFTPGVNGFPQLVTAAGLVEGNPAAPVSTVTAVRTGHAFLDDIAHNAVPKPATPAQGPTPAAPALTPDTNDTITGAAGVQDAGTYDDEMLNAHFVAGDGRLNENIGLSAVHQVFHAEHNRLVGDIQDVITTQDPTQLAEWQLATGAGGWNGERLFQAARFVTEMEYQHLAFEEFARKVQPMVNLFSGYDTSVDPAIAAEFAHAVYRFGHSMLTETVARRTPTGGNRDIPLLDAFLNPPAYAEGGLTPEQATGDIVRGMTDQVGNEIDEFVTEALRNRLLGLPLDLAVLNMARGRETGVPSLNGARRQFFAITNGNSALAPYANWIDFGLSLRHPESLINFVAAYGTHPTITGATTLAGKRAAAELLVAGDPLNPDTPEDAVAFMNGIPHTTPDPVTGEPVEQNSTWVSDANGVTATGLDNVDLWVGGLAEAQAPFGGLLGSSFNFIFETQMENLQDGDRFYYLSRTAGLNLLVQLEGNSFSELISRNTDAENLPADVFSRPDLTFNLAVQAATGPIVDDPTTEYDERTLLTRMTDGTIRYAGDLHVLFVGTPANDRIRSSEGDDTLRGNDANDRLEGGAGNDGLIGGLGEDVLTDTFGDDVLKGGDGNDAMSSGQGFDLNQGGRGNDFIVGGSDPTETFGGPGNDMIFGGDSTDTVFGDDGDDWLEGGGQADLLQGDNGAPFQDDPNTPGHDVINGNGGADDYDSEGGDDIMVAGAGVERNEGMLGFDWVTHKNDPQAADDDMNVTGLLPPAIDALRDRFDLVEGLSGGNLNDTLRGDDMVAADLVGHELDAAGITRIDGLAALLPAAATTFTGGNIIVGGEGNDLLEGRGGDDIIDGDVWLNVRLRAPNLATADPADTKLVDSMTALQADVLAGRINPGDISIVRNIEASPAGTFVDTAIFSGPRADYDVTITGTTAVVVHARNNVVINDGTDTVRNAEQLRFSDTTIAAVTPPATVPGAPTAVAATAGNVQATVTWTVPADGGSPITGFTVTATPAAGTPVTAAATATSATVTGLTNGTAYTFTVQAANAIGAGPVSAPSAAVTPATTPGAPTIGTATAGNASATVRWTAPASNGGSAITSYQVQVLTGTTLVRTVTGIAPTASTVVTGLTNATAYTFRVRAVNALGNGALSAPSTAVTPVGVATAPAAPVIGTATRGNTQATATWTAPANGGSAITSYQVQVFTGTTLNRTVTGIAPTATSTVITGLTNGTAYTFRVRAVNAIGSGTLSAASNVVTPATVPSPPRLVTAVSGTAGGALNATATWAVPTSTGGVPITGYVVRALRFSDAAGTVLLSFTESAVQPATARTLQMTVPVAGNYRFTVRALNAVGTSAGSTRSNVVLGR